MTKRGAAVLLAIALIALGISVHHALTTPWHPTDEQMIEGIRARESARPIKQSTHSLGARIWRA